MYWPEYNGDATYWNSCRVGHLTVTAVDYKGNTVSQTATVTQYAANPQITISPLSQEVEYNEYVDYQVTLVGPALVPTLSYPSNSPFAGQSVNYAWLGTWGDSMVRTNTVRVIPPQNNTLSQRCSSLTFRSETLLIRCF